MAGQITLETMTDSIQSATGGHKEAFIGTGDHLKTVMELDRRNVFKYFYDSSDKTDEIQVESTWLAGEEAGHGMRLPLWAERLIHADVLVMQGKIECSMDYLLHVLGKETQN